MTEFLIDTMNAVHSAGMTRAVLWTALAVTMLVIIFAPAVVVGILEESDH
jgi:hypothetical protein